MEDLLGPAAVDEGTLRAMVAALLGEPVEDLGTVTVEVVDYDLPAITTGGRFWVSGTAPRPWRVFVKHVHEWSRSPFFADVPEEMRELARAAVPWRTEGAVYRSALAEVLPEGLALPRVLGVHPIDDLAYTVWLEVVPTSDTPWDLARFEEAAHLLGRFAASPGVRGLASVGGHDTNLHHYLSGRLATQVFPMLHADAIWEHPLVAPAFGPLRARLLDAVARAEAVVDELAAFPRLVAHGDACPNNLLVRPDAAGFTLIDFGFFGPSPPAFDLGQLLVGDVQIGRRDTADLAERDERCLHAYHRGLLAEGLEVDLADVARAHALQLLVFTGYSTLPFELLDAEPGPALEQVARTRAELARHSLDLVDATTR